MMSSVSTEVCAIIIYLPVNVNYFLYLSPTKVLIYLNDVDKSILTNVTILF